MTTHRGSAPLLTLLLVGLAGALPAEPPAPKTITVAEAWSHMARRETAAAVSIVGQVTFSDTRLGLAYLQDESGGIGFDPRSEAGSRVNVGDTVRVEGFLARRDGVAMVLRHRADGGAARVTPAPETAAPQARVRAIRFDLNDATQMRVDGLLARVSGVVRRIVRPADAGPLMVEISTASGYAVARLRWNEEDEELRRWVNAPVTFSAVLICRALPPLLPEDADALLLAPAKSQWQVQPAALDEVFMGPAVTAATAIQGAPRTAPRQRTHVMGTVTAAKPREWLTLRTEEGSVEVTTRQTGEFRPGEVLAVAAWPMNKNGRLLLQDAVCRSLGTGPEPAAVRLEQGFFNLGLQKELVEVTGEIRNHSFPGGHPRYTLALPNGLRCLLQWSALVPRAEMPEMEDGSLVRLTGIFRAAQNGSPDEEGAGFAVMPRSAADIHVIKGPSWWTRGRLELAIWSLLAVVGIALPGAAIYRWQVWRQALHIRVIESRAATSEERRRIAREFHDSLQQQLAAAALHLETVRGAVEAAPEMLPRLIEDTTAMIRHCQTEAQHCIWDLRTESPAREDLSGSLEAWLRARAAAAAVAVEFYSEGNPPGLGDTAPFQILRICQEAVNNALAHAGASRITVTLQNGKAGLTLKITDDGRGFNPRLLDSPKPGHFGLNSLRERARNIGARLDIRSILLKGTTVTLAVPTPNRLHETAR